MLLSEVFGPYYVYQINSCKYIYNSLAKTLVHSPADLHTPFRYDKCYNIILPPSSRYYKGLH